MSNLIYSLNATLPLVLVVILGIILRKTGFLDQEFGNRSDRFVFCFTIPPTMFLTMYEMDLAAGFDMRLLLYCMGATVLTIFGAWALGKIILRDNRDALGEFIQACYRSSVAVLGYIILSNIYGSTPTAPMMILGSVPLYNIAACLILVLTSPDEHRDAGSQVTKAILGVVKNPIILGIAAGSIASLLHIHVPAILLSTARSVGSLTAPLTLISIGIGFKGKEVLGEVGPSVTATVFKLILIPLIFVPIAALMGFRGDSLVTILVMLASPVAPASYTMARKFGHSGVISASTIMLTTVGSAITLTIWLTILKSLNMV